MGVSFRKSPRPSFLIKRAALGNLKASFHCTHWHRFFPLKRAPPLTPTLFNGLYTPFGSPVSGGQKPQGRGRKPPYSTEFSTSPSLLQGELHLSSRSSPLREEEGNRPTRCSEPLRSKVGGASKPSPDIVRDGTALLQLASGLRHLVRGCDRMGIAVYSLQLIVYSLRLISWLFADNMQISFDFLGGFEKKA